MAGGGRIARLCGEIPATCGGERDDAENSERHQICTCTSHPTLRRAMWFVIADRCVDQSVACPNVDTHCRARSRCRSGALNFLRDSADTESVLGAAVYER